MKAIGQLFFLFFAVLAGCGQTPSPSSKKTQLLVSLPPYKTLVEEIAGDSFEVITVVPLNADPHTYEPTSKQLAGLAQGKIWFRIGEPFEQKLLPLLKAKSTDMRQGVTLIEDHHHCCHAHDTQDRHIWLTPDLMSTQAELIAKTLSLQYPEKKEVFAENLSAVQAKLKALDLEIASKISPLKQRTFVISHPAFAYFCREYNCRQLSVEHEGKEPRPKEVEELLIAADENNAKLAIALPQHNNKGAQLIAGKLHIPVRIVDPYAADYKATMLKLAALIENPYQTDYE